MSNIAISYASTTREQALEIVERLRSAGLDVWIDDAGRADAEVIDIGVPAGQRHWDVIAAALDRTAGVLVLDSDAWRQSVYCWREYRHARDAGKRIAVVAIEKSLPNAGGPAASWAPTSLDEVLDAGGNPDPVIDAHTRLLIAYRAGGSLRWSRPSVARLAKDVELLATADVAGSGITITPELAELSDDVLRAARRRKRMLRGAGSALLAALAVITAVAAVARSGAIASRQRAGQESALQQSLQLASASRVALTTADRVDLARQAMSAAPTVEAEAAVAEAAEFSEGRTRFVSGTLGTALAAAVSDAGSRVALVTIGQQQRTRTLTLFDAQTGSSIGSWELPTTLLPDVAISPDGSKAAVAGLSDNSVTFVDATSGRVEIVPTNQPVVAFGFTRENSLWWADSFGNVGAINDGEPVVIASLLTTTRAVAADPRTGDLYVLGGAGELHTLRASSGGTYAVLATTQAVFDGPPPVAAGDSPLARYDRLLVCESRITAVRQDAWAVVDDGAVVDTGTSVGLSFASTTFACFGDHVVRIALGSVGTFPEDLDHPMGLNLLSKRARIPFGSNASGTHLVVVQPDGIIDVLSVDHAPVQREYVDSVAMVTFDDRVVLLSPEGTMRRAQIKLADDVESFGEVGSRLTTSLVTRVVDSWFVGVEGGLGEIRPNGTVVFHDPEQDGRIRRTYRGTALIAGDESIVEFGLGDGSTPSRSVTTPGILPNESLFEAHGSADPDTYVATTTFGRLLLVDASTGSVLAETQAAPAGRTPVVVTPGGLILVAGADGVVRQFDAQLKPLRSAILGPASLSSELSPDGSMLLVQSMQDEAHVVNASTLAVVLELGESTGRLYQFSGDGSAIVGLELTRAEGSWIGAVTSTPLPLASRG